MSSVISCPISTIRFDRISSSSSAPWYLVESSDISSLSRKNSFSRAPSCQARGGGAVAQQPPNRSHASLPSYPLLPFINHVSLDLEVITTLPQRRCELIM